MFVLQPEGKPAPETRKRLPLAKGALQVTGSILRAKELRHSARSGTPSLTVHCGAYSRAGREGPRG
jgi:hypothetical protein